MLCIPFDYTKGISCSHCGKECTEGHFRVTYLNQIMHACVSCRERYKTGEFDPKFHYVDARTWAMEKRRRELWDLTSCQQTDELLKERTRLDIYINVPVPTTWIRCDRGHEKFEQQIQETVQYWKDCIKSSIAHLPDWISPCCYAYVLTNWNDTLGGVYFENDKHNLFNIINTFPTECHFLDSEPVYFICVVDGRDKRLVESLIRKSIDPQDWKLRYETFLTHVCVSEFF